MLLYLPFFGHSFTVVKIVIAPIIQSTIPIAISDGKIQSTRNIAPVMIASIFDFFIFVADDIIVLLTGGFRLPLTS